MQKTLVAILMVSLLISCGSGAGYSFSISGTLKNTPSKVVYLEETNTSTGENTVKDSSKIDDNGKYSIKIKSNHEGIYTLRLQNDVSNFATVINDESTIKLDADFSKHFDFYSVSGSKASKGIQEYLAKMNEMQREKFNYIAQIDSIRANHGDSVLAENLNDKQREISKQLKNYTKQTIEQSTNGSFALNILSTYVVMSRDPNYKIKAFTGTELLALLNVMANKYPNRTDIAGIRNAVESSVAKTIWVGKQAPEIAMPDAQGKKISLSSFRGKYVLVDFWASWCAPCRRENPNVVEAYHRFKNKNFDILGVSLDRPGEKDRWIQAVKEDNLTWTQISDLSYWNSAAVSLYKLSSIPFNVLVDPNGLVVGENLRGDELEEKLDEVLK